MYVNKTQYLLTKKLPTASLEVIDTIMGLNTHCNIFSMMDDYKKLGVTCLLEDGIVVELDFEL